MRYDPPALKRQIIDASLNDLLDIVLSLLEKIPGTVSAIVMEKTLKESATRKRPDNNMTRNTEGEINDAQLLNASEVPHGSENIQTYLSDEIPQTEEKEEQLNMIYVLFWMYLWTFFSVFALLWTDFIPQYGLVKDPALFGKQ